LTLFLVTVASIRVGRSFKKNRVGRGEMFYM